MIWTTSAATVKDVSERLALAMQTWAGKEMTLACFSEAITTSWQSRKSAEHEAEDNLNRFMLNTDWLPLLLRKNTAELDRFSSFLDTFDKFLNSLDLDDEVVELKNSRNDMHKMDPFKRKMLPEKNTIKIIIVWL